MKTVKFYYATSILITLFTLSQTTSIAQEKRKNQSQLITIKSTEAPFLITKTTTDFEIREYCRHIKKLHNLNLSFFNIKRNDNNEIIRLIGAYQRDSDSPIATIYCNGSKPIKPLEFIYDYSKNILFLSNRNEGQL